MRLFHGNSFFRKDDRDRWTHRMTVRKNKVKKGILRELDHILSNSEGSFCKVEVVGIGKERFDSDHRLLRATMCFIESSSETTDIIDQTVAEKKHNSERFVKLDEEHFCRPKACIHFCFLQSIRERGWKTDVSPSQDYEQLVNYLIRAEPQTYATFSSDMTRTFERMTLLDLRALECTRTLFSSEEIEDAINCLTPSEFPDSDGISTQMLMAGCYHLYELLAESMSFYFAKRQIPNQWRCGKDPILLLHSLYIELILKRISSTLDGAQNVEQAGFCENSTKLAHIQTVSNVIEFCRDRRRKVDLYLTFIKYENPLESVDINAVLSALKGYVDENFRMAILDCCFHRFARHKTASCLRQCGSLAPKLTNTALELRMRTLQWKEKGIKGGISGRVLSNLRYLDDIVIFSSSLDEAKTMLKELDDVGAAIGLRIDRNLTKFMTNDKKGKNQFLDEGKIEQTLSHVYLGRSINMDLDLLEELDRIQQEACAACLRLELSPNLPQNVDELSELFDREILPVLCFAAETWSGVSAAKFLEIFCCFHRSLRRNFLKKGKEEDRFDANVKLEQSLQEEDRFDANVKLEQSLQEEDRFDANVKLEQSLQEEDRVDAESKPERSPEEEDRIDADFKLLKYAWEMKHRWAGQIIRAKDNRWTKATLLWVTESPRFPGKTKPMWADVFKSCTSTLKKKEMEEKR
ncbi:hypothetical protein OESDEN_07896 [Oesophagostomum dentatum]|uniref:Reverse transcriptase domain-containing protein n=1 Tax=Oesophagostomum dentatum TaxID=61180 RepID=A0A0B1T3V1_OESDE|nr:hypothetical protein OESDEN_07896 [Oesophagostomum dentatum]